MTTDSRPQFKGTLAVMLETAVALEATEMVLHRTAEQSPDPVAAERLHRLGDQVTAKAKEIARRAGDLPPVRPRVEPGTGS